MNNVSDVKKTTKKKTEEELKKLRDKRRKKVVIKWLKRVLVGPLLGFWLAFASYNIFHGTLIVSIAIFIALTSIGILVRFRYIKYAYIGIVGLIYVLLISNLVND